MSGVTALGNDYTTIEADLKKKRNAIIYMPEWEKFDGLNTKLASPIKNFELPTHYTRKHTRAMGRVAKMACLATEQALKQNQLIGSDALIDGSCGVAYGSSSGSPPAHLPFTNMVQNFSTKGITATTYVQMMSHTCAVNIALHFGAKGRIIPTSSACTSGSQAIGYSYESIRHGHQKIMIAGGADELCASEAAVFDTLFATSTKNQHPNLTPAPFDKNRDGLVIGEGASTLILEELEHAQKRGANIYAEVLGFGTNCDASHVTQPQKQSMGIAMKLALSSASLDPCEIGYISAHGTATDRGDIAETNATADLFGSKVPISSMKSYFGHTLGACGAMEAWLAIEMMNRNWFAPTINLNEVDPLCGDLDYIKDCGREINCEIIMSNNFAFGGINTSLIFKRWHNR
jgi:3-oxoacyl-[acyl-carrier-protein] synthase II